MAYRLYTGEQDWCAYSTKVQVGGTSGACQVPTPYLEGALSAPVKILGPRFQVFI